MPWRLLDVVVVGALYIASGILGRDVTRVLLGVSSIAPDELPPEHWMAVMLGSALGLLIGVALAALWLRLAVRATWEDLGLRDRDGGAHAKLGLIGFLVLMVPIYSLQFVLSYLYQRLYDATPQQNPLIDQVREHPGAVTFVVAGFVAIVVAPLTEEFVFRAVLQGWLERLLRPGRDESARTEPLADEDALTPQPGLVLWTPIAVSSLVFALMHYSHGVAWVPLFFFALGLGYLYQRTRSLVAPIVLHMSLNASTMLILWLSALGERV